MDSCVNPSYDPRFETGESSFHVHKFYPEDAMTDHPVGVWRGHRHEIIRDSNGLVTGFGEAEGHTHELPEWVLSNEDPKLRKLSAESELSAYEPAIVIFEDQKKKKSKKKEDMEEEEEEEEEEEDGEKDGDLYSIKGVEVFKVGKWNGDEYSEDDLDSMIDAFNEVGFQVPIKLGHKEISGSPAYGWVEKIYRSGKKLLADFKDLPEKLYEAIRKRRFDAVSSEIFWNLERDGKKFRRVLKAVALLGGETPAVSGLAPLRTVVNKTMPPEGGLLDVHCYSFNMDKGDDMEKLAELQEKVDKLQSNLDEATEAQAAAEKKVKEMSEGGSTDKKKLEKAEKTAAEAEEKVETLSEELNDAKKQVKKLSEEKDKEISDLRTQVASLTSKIGDISEERRQDRIKKKVGELPIPALRRYFHSLYDVATSTARTVKFAEKEGDKEADLSVEAILDKMLDSMKSDALKIFREFAKGGHPDRQEGGSGEGAYDDPSAEADKRARKYMDECGDKKVTYAAAVEHVLKADKDLAEQYRGFHSSGRQN